MGYHEELDVLPATRHALTLVVADDRTHRVVVTRLVQAAGYGVWSCASPATVTGGDLPWTDGRERIGWRWKPPATT